MSILKLYQAFYIMEEEQVHKIKLDEDELKTVRLSLYNFKNLKTRGYEKQFERIIRYLNEAKPDEYIYLYDDEIQIIQMCLFSISEVANNEKLN